ERRMGGGRSDRRAAIHPSYPIERVGCNSVLRRSSPRYTPSLLTLRGHAGGLDHRGDTGDLALDQLLQAGGAALRALGRRAAELNVTPLNRGIIERLAERVPQ